MMEQADHDNSPLAMLRRSSFYQSFIRHRKLATTKIMSDSNLKATATATATAAAAAQDVREQPEKRFIRWPTSSVPPPSMDVTNIATTEEEEDDDDDDDDDKASANIPSPESFNRRTQSYSVALTRLSGRLRCSFHLANRRERAAKFIADGTVALEHNLKPPPLLREFREGTFTKYANVKIVSYIESYGNIQLIRQIFRQNRPDEIKRLLRKTNWPIGHEIRTDLWQEICRYDNPDFNANKGGYGPETKGWEELDGRFTPKVRFLQTSDTIRNNYELNETGLAALHRIIRALDSMHPTLSYAPLLRPMLALFLHYMNEEDAYACGCRLLRNHAIYMNDSTVARKASAYTLLALLKSYKSAVYKSLKSWIESSEEKHLAKALYNWPTWIFCALPFDYLVRIVDCYLYEGSKILIRIAIILLHTWHKTTKKPSDLAGKNFDERIELLATSIEQNSRHIGISLPILLENAVRIRNFRGAKIAHLQEKYVKMILKTEGAGTPPPDFPAMHTRPFISSIVTPDIAFQLMCHLPEKFQIRTPELIYQLTKHGNSFNNFWTNIDEAEQTLIIIKTDTGEILGAFCDEPWGNRKKRRRDRGERGIYFGGALSFVWNIGKNNELNVFGWKVGQPENFMAAPYDPNATVLMIGGNAILIRDELVYGSSLSSNTFNNRELVENGAFVIEDMEVFAVCEWESNYEEDEQKKIDEKDAKRKRSTAGISSQSPEHHSGEGDCVGEGTFVKAPGLAGF